MLLYSIYTDLNSNHGLITCGDSNDIIFSFLHCQNFCRDVIKGAWHSKYKLRFNERWHLVAIFISDRDTVFEMLAIQNRPIRDKLVLHEIAILWSHYTDCSNCPQSHRYTSLASRSKAVMMSDL